MKKKAHLLMLFSMALTLTLTSCIWGETDDLNESDYEAVTVSREALETSTELLATKPLEETGKIYIKDQYLLINEPNQGFHIYDNSDPSNPTKIKFLKVLGSSDISIKGNVLYINNAVDLIALTYDASFNTIQITKRVRNVFPEMLSPDGFFPNQDSNDIVVDWILN